MRVSGRTALVLSAAVCGALIVAGCGGEEEKFSDKKIVETLGLEQTDGAYAIGGDPFCEVDRKLLNDADEVDSAGEADELGLVIASGEGNVGVQGVPPFAPDCKQQAKKQLNKLDPQPRDD
jgi:hypothetical protein